MERTTAQVGSQRWIFIRGALLLVLGASAAWGGGAEGGADFLIVGDPGKIVIYDRYQRLLPPGERGALGQFVPMQVLADRILLGDGITECKKVDSRGDVLYLLLDNGDRLAGDPRAADIRQFSDSTPLLDTIAVLHDRGIAFEPAGGLRSQILRFGERLTRIFRHSTRTYVMRHESPQAYGWVELDERDLNRTWEVVAATAISGSVITNRIRDSVLSRITHVNEMFSRLFAYFNSSTHNRREPPRWVVLPTGNAITCSLEKASEPDSFGESTRYLTKDLENVILGSGLGVFTVPGKIVIRPK